MGESLHISIPRDLKARLLELVSRKYARSHGAVSNEVKLALESWLDEHEPAHKTQTTQRSEQIIPKSHEHAISIIEELSNILEKEPADIFQFTRQQLDKAIERTRGMDIRTKKKWIGFLSNNGYISNEAPGVFKLEKFEYP